MSQQIERQIELLTDAKNIIIQHTQQLENLYEMFNNAIISLETDELNHDYVEYLHEIQSEYNRNLKGIIQEFELTVIPTLENKIKYLDER